MVLLLLLMLVLLSSTACSTIFCYHSLRARQVHVMSPTDDEEMVAHIDEILAEVILILILIPDLALGR